MFKMPKINVFEKMGSNMSRFMGRTSLKIEKNLPEITFALGIVGFVGTIAIAYKQATKTKMVLEDHERNMADMREAMELEDFSLDEVKRDKLIFYSKTAVDLVKVSAPVVALGAFSITCFLVSRNVLNKRYLAAVSAYNGLSEVFKAYRKRVVDEYGEDLDRHFRYGTTYRGEEIEVVDEKGKKKKEIEKISETNTKDIVPGDLSVVFDESNHGNFTNSRALNLAFLKAMQLKCTDILRTRGHLFLNEVYDFLGFEHTQAGAVVGWIMNETSDGYVDFGLYKPEARNFINGSENTVLLQFNHDGIIYDKI